MTTTTSPVYYARRFNQYVSELWRRRDFVWFFARGNIKARNASTFLGLVWWVLNPLLLGLVYFFIFGFIFPSDRDLAYLLSGMFVFHYSSQSLSGGAASIISNSKLLVNIRFPRLILPIAFLLESTFGFLASLVVFYAIVIPFAGVVPGPEILLLLVALPLQILFNLGLAAASARLAVPFRDINNLIPYLNRIWLYTTPIIWPISMLTSMSETAQTLFRLNPMFSIIALYRTALLGYPLDRADLIAAVIWCVRGRCRRHRHVHQVRGSDGEIPVSRPALKVENVSVHFRPYVDRRPTLRRSLATFRHKETQLVEALKSVSFEVQRGEAFGIVGQNGAGKSTLLRVVARTLRPDDGRVVVRGRMSTLLQLGVGFNAELSGSRNIYLGGLVAGLTKKQVDERYDEIVEYSELGEAIYRPMKTYSSGMFSRLAFAVAMHLDPEILLLDEVLAVGDEGFKEKSMATMNELLSKSGSIVFVSHAVRQLAEFCDRAAWLDRGELVAIGDAEEVVEQYRAFVQQRRKEMRAQGLA